VHGAAIGAEGRLADGREELTAGKALLHDLGDLIAWAGITAIEADFELAAGEPERAYRALAVGAEVLAASSETGYLATVTSLQAQAALELGREEEAMRLTDAARGIAVVDDIDPLARDLVVRARVSARRGDFGEADELIAAASEMLEETDAVNLRLEHAFGRAELARLAGRDDEQRGALSDAVAVAEAKGYSLVERRARGELAALGHGGGA